MAQNKKYSPNAPAKINRAVAFLYENPTALIGDVAGTFNVDRRNLEKAMRKAGIPTRNKGRPRKIYPVFLPEAADNTNKEAKKGIEMYALNSQFSVATHPARAFTIVRVDIQRGETVFRAISDDGMLAINISVTKIVKE